MRDRIRGLKTVSIDKIRNFKHGNPKTHTAEDRELLDASLDEHGYVLPISVRRDADGFELIDGHHRLVALAARGAAKVRVIVLDVESAEEGRRLILSLQHTASWDMSALEDYVKGMIVDEVASADDIMRLTGLSGDDLDALASAAGDGAATEDDDESKSASRAGLTTEHVTFSTPLARDQNELVRRALKLCKGREQTADRKPTNGDALTSICRLYLETKGEAT